MKVFSNVNWQRCGNVKKWCCSKVWQSSTNVVTMSQRCFVPKCLTTSLQHCVNIFSANWDSLKSCFCQAIDTYKCANNSKSWDSASLAWGLTKTFLHKTLICVSYQPLFIFIQLCSHCTNYFRCNCKTKHLGIIRITIYQPINVLVVCISRCYHVSYVGSI